MSSSNVVSLYRSLLREGKRFQDYNVSSYVVRSVRNQFREPVETGEAEEIAQRISFGTTQLDLLKRQTTLSTFFPSGSNVMEKIGKI